MIPLLQVVDLPPIDFSDGRWWIYVLLYLAGRFLNVRLGLNGKGR